MLHSTTVISIDTKTHVSLVSTITWNSLQVNEILVGRARNPGVSLFRLKNLTWVNNIVFEIQDENWTRDIPVNADIIEGICRYFQWNPKLDNDCLGCITQILGWKKGARFVDDGDYNYKGLEEYDESTIQSWDVIFMVSRNTEKPPSQGYYHYALYLGEGYFFSKLWFEWRIVITSFEQLQACNEELDYTFRLLLEKK